MATHQVQNNARKSAVYGETEPTEHALQTGKPKGIQNRFLQPTQSLGCGVANHHVLFPLTILAIGVEEIELGSMKENQRQVVVGVQVSDVWRRKPWRGTIRGESDREIRGKVVQPRVEGRVELHKFGINAPVLRLLLLQAAVGCVHAADVTNDSCKVGEVPSSVIFGVIASRDGTRNTEVDGVQLNRKIGSTYDV